MEREEMGTQHNKMRLVLFWNYLNHHQVHLADAFYELLGNRFVFVATLPVSQADMKGGSDYSHEREYCINPNDGKRSEELARKYAREAEVAIFGACSLKYAVERAKNGNGGLSFDCSERWFKKGLINIISPVFLKWYYSYIKYFRKNNYYKLCAGSFVSKDNIIVGAYRNRCFKWGYFVKAEESGNEAIAGDNNNILWCGRFLKWKHPEMIVSLARQLNNNGIPFSIDMVGEGKYLNRMKKKVFDEDLSDKVHFWGAIPNDNVHEQMKRHGVLLFTSDQREGWGVIINEAMINGCVVVASDKAGATGFLIKDLHNGLIFQSQDVKSLYEKVVYLINNPTAKREISKNASETMKNIWSPQNAAKSFLKLVNELEEGHQPSIVEGPCSKA